MCVPLLLDITVSMTTYVYLISRHVYFNENYTYIPICKNIVVVVCVFVSKLKKAVIISIGQSHAWSLYKM